MVTAIIMKHLNVEIGFENLEQCERVHKAVSLGRGVNEAVLLASAQVVLLPRNVRLSCSCVCALSVQCICLLQ